jgi:Tol biopolymer transport system component/tRNA A-37 threonylcarbamoyl transferase component Bud32
MTPERYQQIARLYHAALELTAAERAAFLSTACGGDDELRREVETLLASDEEAGGQIRVPVRQFAAELLAEDEETLRGLVSAGPSLSPGQVLSGRYEIVRFVARGGMGEVYEADDRELRERVALKTVRPEIASDARAMSRFRREIQLARKVTHPNVCRIYDLSRHRPADADDQSGEITFLTMELLRGVTLSEALRQQGRLTMEAALPLISQMAAALGAAHQASVIHRDFKSSNVMLVEAKSGAQAIRAVVTDFGLARSSAGDESFAQSVSTAGEIVGTPAYMAPEQVEGQEVTSAADIYALGVVIYEMVTGSLPFLGDTPFATALKRLREAPSSPRALAPDLDPNWETAILRCLARNPAERFTRAEDVVKALKGEEVPSAATPAAAARQPSAQIPTAPRSRWLVQPMMWAGALLIIAGVAFLFWQFNPQRRAATRLPSLQFDQLTEQLGEELYPSFAPDGKSFVYASRAAGNWDIYLQRVGGKNPINLTKDSVANETQPAISPDGNRIVFRSERDGGGLYVMGATGEDTKRLADFGFNPSWSPHGEFIACNEQSVASAYARGVIPCLTWIINVKTGEKRRLSDRDALQPQWSPQGKRIAYWGVSEGTRPRDIWTIPVEGGEPVAVTNDAAVDWNPVWSPDGQYLYFASDRSGSMNLWRVPIEEASGRVLGPLEPVTTPSVNSAQLSFARDGRLLYVRQETQKNLQRIAFDPASEKIVGDPVWITSSARQATFPSLSPDGEWLTFCATGDKQEDIFIARRDGSEVRNLTDDMPKDRNPRWSPNGKRLAFFSDRGGRWEVWLINADGTGLRQLTHTSGTPVTNPLWSPDGARLAFSLSGSGPAFIVEPDKPWEGQTPLQIPSAPLPGIRFIAWGWSADGQKLVGFHRGIEEYDSGIGVYSFTTKRVEPLAEFGGFPLWLKDSRRVIFVARGRMLLGDTQTKQTRELFSVAPHRIEGFTLSGDDRQIYFSRASNEADIWMMSVK